MTSFQVFDKRLLLALRLQMPNKRLRLVKKLNEHFDYTYRTFIDYFFTLFLRIAAFLLGLKEPNKCVE